MKSFTLIAVDQTGLVAHITEIMADAGLNIIQMEAQLIHGNALVNLVIDEPEAAMHHLTEAGYQVVTNELIMLRLTDTPGALAQATRQLADEDIDIRGVSILQRHGGLVYVAISTADDVRAAHVLSSVLHTPVTSTTDA